MRDLKTRFFWAIAILVIPIPSLFWLPPGELLAHGLIYPWPDPPVLWEITKQYFFTWVRYWQGDPNSELVGSLFNAYSFLLTLIGGGSHGGQVLSFYFGFVGCVGGMFFLARTLGFTPIASLISGVFYLLSPMVMSGMPVEPVNLRILPFYVSTPILLSFVVRIVGSSPRKSDWVLFVIFSIILGSASYSSLQYFVIHLALFASYSAYRVILVWADTLSCVRILRQLFILLFFTFLSNVYWLGPMLYDLLSVYNVRAEPGFSDVDVLRGLSVKLIDGLRMLPYPHQATISPWFDFYYSSYMTLVTISLAVISGFAFLSPRTRRVALYPGLLLIGALFLAKGTRSPLSSVGEFIFLSIPYVTRLFRNPTYFETPVVLAIALLIGLAIGEIIRMVAAKSWRLLAIVVVAVLTLTCLYGLQFVIGGPVKSQYVLKPSQSVKVPSYYTELTQVLHDDPGTYRIISIPTFARQSEFVAYRWGKIFFGMPSISLWSGKPTLRPFYQGKKDSLLESAMYPQVDLISEDTWSSLMRLSNVRYIAFHRDTEWTYLHQHDLLPERIEEKRITEFILLSPYLKRIKTFEKIELYELDPQYFLPLIYGAGVSTPISGDFDTLVPLFITTTLGSYPSLVFTERQPSKALEVLVNNHQSMISSHILFSNRNFNDLVIDLAKAEGQSDSRQSTVNSQKPGAVGLDKNGMSKFKVEDSGIYEFWVKTEGKGLEGIDAIGVDDYKFPIEKKQDRADRWVKVGTGGFKKGGHRITLSRQQKSIDNQKLAGSNDDKEEFKRFIQDTEVVIVSEKKRKGYEELLKKRGVAYLFYKEEDTSIGRTQPIAKRDFYIPDDKAYDLTAFIRPRREKVRAYAINERFEDGALRNWNLGKSVSGQQSVGIGQQSAVGSQRSKIESQATQDTKPIFLFGENFYTPEKLSYPLQEKMWRWMANDGKLVILNPFSTSITVDLSLTAASFQMDRNLALYVNKKHQKTVIVPGPLKKVSKKVLKQIAEIKDLGLASGLPAPIVMKGLTLQPGINEITFSPSPSATVVGDQNRLAVSIAISDEVQVVPSKPASVASLWANRKGFNAGVEDEALFLEDNYREKGEEVAWISRPIEKVSLNDYPLFIIKYAWQNPQIQAMDVGFQIDTDRDGQGDAYLVRTLPDPVPGLNRFEIDLLETVWENFADALNPYLVGIYVFPHKKWGVDASGVQGENRQSYFVKGIQVASKEGSVVVKGKESFMGTVFSGKGSYSVSQDGDGLSVSLTLGGRKGESASTVANIPLRQRLGGEASLFVLPYRLKDEYSQDLKVFVSYDLNKDGKADNKTVPVGRRIPIPGWKLLTRDMKEPMFLYEATLPSFFPAEYNTAGKRFRNFVVIKNGVPLFPTWENDFVISREQVQVEGVRVTINLPRGVDPDDFSYEVFYTPKEWVKESSWFHGFKELVFDMRDLEQDLFEKKVKPVGIKLVLEGRISEAVEQERIYDFEIKAPRYTYSVLPRLGNLSVKENMPVIRLDGDILGFDDQRVDKEKGGIWISKRVSLQEGEHRLRVVEQGGLEAYLVEIKPVSRDQSAGTSRQSAVGRDQSTGTSRQSTVGNQQHPKIDFKKINPTRYIVDVKDTNGPFTLVFSESFHERWKAYIRQSAVESQQSEEQSTVSSQQSRLSTVDDRLSTINHRLSTIDEPWLALWSAWRDRAQRVEVKDHFVVNGYANGWIVDLSAVTGRQSAVGSEQSEELSAVGSPQSFEIVLEYKPQRLFEIGLMISGLTLLGCITYLGYDFVRRRKPVSSR